MQRIVQGLTAVIGSVVVIAGSAPGAEPAAELSGTTWRADDIDGRGVIDFLQSTITFDADGRVSGRAGCNRYTGTWTLDGARIEMGPFAATRMACPEAVMDQESRFLEALDAVERIENRHGLLYLYAGEATRLRLSPYDEPESEGQPGTKPTP